MWHLLVMLTSLLFDITVAARSCNNVEAVVLAHGS